MEKPLEGMKVAVLATDMFEEDELKKPLQALKEAGAITHIIAPKGPTIIAAHHFDKGSPYRVDRLLQEADPADYDAVLLPGGALNADSLRAEPAAQRFIQHFDATDKPIAVICHAAWLLVSAGLIQGRTLTSYHTIADDIKNAGGNWIDKEVIQDGNWVSSRQPDDIPAFNAAMLELFGEAYIDTEEMSAKAAGTPQMAFREKLSDEKEDLS